jgi:ubiquinone/menaquinone biosynthesis C-methylase UbiE
MELGNERSSSPIPDITRKDVSNVRFRAHNTGQRRGREIPLRASPMAEVSKFTQPNEAPAYFIEFLDFLDNQEEIADLREKTATSMRLRAGQKALDLGCGIGGATFRLAELTGPSGLIAGVDVSSALIDVAVRRANGRPGVEFRVGDACAIPYPDGYFDAARSERVFLYLPDRIGAIREMKRVVKPGGRVCLVDTDIDSTAIYSTKPALTRKMTSIVAASMPNPNSARELPALAKQAGLSNIEIEIFAVTSPYEFLVRVMTDSLNKAAESGLTTRAEVAEWMGEQATVHASGGFFQLWFFVLVTGTV